MKTFGGKVLFLDRSDINTDEIIPAKYLTEITKDALKPFCLEDLKLGSFNPKTDVANKGVVITRANFGCGSSREHAPWALEVNGIYAVIAENFARIFRQNMYNCGMLAVELDKSSIDSIFSRFGGKETTASINAEKGELVLKSGSTEEKYSFKISEFDMALVKAGGWVDYADKNY